MQTLKTTLKTSHFSLIYVIGLEQNKGGPRGARNLPSTQAPAPGPAARRPAPSNRSIPLILSRRIVLYTEILLCRRRDEDVGVDVDVVVI